MRKPSLKEGKELTQGYTASKEKSWGLSAIWDEGGGGIIWPPGVHCSGEVKELGNDATK